MLRPTILLIGLISAVQAHCPAQCQCDQWNWPYRCDLNGSIVLLNPNEYFGGTLHIKCEGSSNFTCADLPTLELNYTVTSLDIDECPPRLLRCINILTPRSRIWKLQLSYLTEEPEPADVEQLTEVSYLSLKRDHGPQILSTSVFKALPALSDLQQGYSQPTYEGFGKLQALDLDYYASSLPRDIFKGLHSLQSLTLHNPLSSLEEGLLSHTPVLHKIRLYFAQASITHIPGGLFTKHQNLKDIFYVGNRNLQKLDNLSIASLPSLQTIYFNNCQFRILSENTLANSSALLTIQLEDNGILSIPAKFFADQVELITLDLSGNVIETLPEGIFRTLKKLETLNLNENNFKILPHYIFDGLQNLKHLHLDDNLLTTISDSVFRSTPQLITLSIARNQLTLASETHLSPFHQLRRLQELLLKWNYLNVIFDDWRNELVNLRRLDLSQNLFLELEIKDVLFHAKNVTIDLGKNEIRKINFPCTPPVYPAYQTNNRVLLENNPLTCDCQLFPLILRLRGINISKAEPQFVVGHTICTSPVQYKGDHLENFSPSAFNCDLPLKHSDNCSSCTLHAPSNILELDCNTAPYALSEVHNSVTLKLNQYPNSISELNVDTLNLTGLGIKYVPSKLPKKLRVIDLSNNLLEVPPIQLFKQNISLYLAKNKFKCECQYLDELSFLVANPLVLDRSDLRCDDGERIDIDLLCSSIFTPVSVAGVTLTVLAILLIIICAITYEFSNEIISYLIQKGIGARYFIDEDVEKKYDVFISFSHKDLDLVEELTLKLEQEFKLKTCVHHRDWNVGEFIATQITRSVECSRWTVIVLSRHYLESMWATVEFNVAYSLALRESRARVIMILLEDVSSDTALPEEIRDYMATNTYLMWRDSKFWEKLHRALPKRRKKFVWRNSTDHA